MNFIPRNRQQWLVFIAAAGLLLLLLDRIVFTPLLEGWRERANEIARLEKSVSAGRVSIERAALTQRAWSDLQSRTLAQDAAQAEHDLISAVDRWGHTSSVELGAIKPQWKRGASNRYSLLECRIEASGSLPTLGRFLFELEKAPLALRIESLELSSRDDTGQRLSLNVVISGLRLFPLEGKP